MPKPVPVPIRRKIGERSLQGESAAELAIAFDLPPRTVRELLKRFRERGESGLAPDYKASARPAHAKSEEIRQAVLQKRRDHPTWGAELIRVALVEQRPDLAWPSSGIMRVWFRRAGLAKAPPGRRPGPARGPRATEPHQTWQVDACEEVGLKGGALVSWLRVVDEASGAVLGTTVFPPRVLVPSRPESDAGGPETALRPMGDAPAAAGRQWDSLGLAR